MTAWPRGAGMLAAVSLLAVNAATGAAPATTWADPAKTLRVALPVAETGFDPAASGELYSNIVISALFDTLYEWDYLALPRRVVPRAAVALPEISVDGLTWTIRLRQGSDSSTIRRSTASRAR